MKNIIFIGSGGFAKEIFGYISTEITNKKLSNHAIKGFLDLTEEDFIRSNINSTYLGTESSYKIKEDDVFVITVGETHLREKIITILDEQNATFFSYIHSTAIVDKNTILGKGIVICPFCMVNSNAKIGDFCMLNIYSSIAHDCVIGNNSILSPYATINGGVEAKNNLFMGTRSTITPLVKIQEDCVIAAGTTVTKNMEPKTLAFPQSRTKYLTK